MAEPLRSQLRAFVVVVILFLVSTSPVFSSFTETGWEVTPPGEEEGGFFDTEELANRVGGDKAFTAENQTQILNIGTYPDGFSSNLRVEVPAGEALTDVNLQVKPRVLARDEMMEWTDISVWNHSGSSSDSVNYNNSGLTLAGADQNWDLNNNGQVPVGWTRSSSTYSMINSLSCGRNGSSGHSLNTRGGNTWWQSPTVDMGGLSQGEVSYWVRSGYSGCGEEPDSGENLYLEIRTSSGSWTAIKTFSGSPYCGGCSGNTFTTSLPSSAFHANFALRFRQNYGSGTCCDYWFFDDVTLTQPGGEGNWTSPSFGRDASADFGLEPGPYSLLSFDVDLPGTSQFSWTLLDAVTMSPITGFEDRTDRVVDLGTINWAGHPKLKIAVYMAAGSGGVPTLNGIYIGGKVIEKFDRDPTLFGWSTEGPVSTSNGQVSGNGNITSPLFTSIRPIARVMTDFTVSGSGYLQIQVDEGVWTTISTNTLTNFVDSIHKVRFRWIGTGSWTMTEAEFELVPGNMPLHPRIDIARDSSIEWGLLNSAIGPWGWQDRLDNGYTYSTFNFASSGQNPSAVGLWLPSTGVEDLRWSLSALYGGVGTNTSWSVGVGTTPIANGTQSSLIGISDLSLSEAELVKLNQNLSVAPTVHTVGDIDFVEISISLYCESCTLQISGISAPYQSLSNLSFNAWSDLVQNINDIIPDSSVMNGKRIVAIPFGMDLIGSVEATITRVSSISGLQSTGALLVNQTNTLAPSWQWLELTSWHESSVGAPASIQFDIIGLNNHTSWTFPVDGSPPTGKFDTDLIRFHPTNPHTVIANNTHVNSTIRFQFEPMWDDEEDLQIRVRVVLVDGRRSISQVASFGGGSNQGLENDVLITEWSVLNDLWREIPPSTPYLRGGKNITVKAIIGFQNADSSLAPRKGDVLVELYQNDYEIYNTTQVERGLFNHTFQVPLGTSDMTYRIEITPLHGGSDMTTLVRERTFKTDSLAPLLINTNIEHYDHRSHNSNQLLKFEIYDRPVLPADMSVMLWREWINDYNFNGWPDEDEYKPFGLTPPSNLSMAQGNYTFTFDDHTGSFGDKVAGYLTGSDPAGNPLIDSGGPGIDDHLFMYQLEADGAPIVQGENATVNGDISPWLHPGNSYELIVPFREANGYSDVDEIVIQLASNSQNEVFEIIWLASDNRCHITSSNFQVNSCNMRAQSGPIGPYVDDLQLEIGFSIAWELIPEGDLRREPTVEIFDRARQSTYLSLPHLRWRWSTDLHIPLPSMSLWVGDGQPTSEGAWAYPGSDIGLQGMVTFAESSQTPGDEIEVEFILDGIHHSAIAYNGTFNALLEAPLLSGNHPLSWKIGTIPSQANDVTDRSTALYWIVVDGDGPNPIEVVTPRSGRIILLSELSELEFDVRIAETQQIDPDSLHLQWMITEGESSKGIMVADGSSPLSIPDGVLSSLQLSTITQIDILNGMEMTSFSEQLYLHIWVTGSDAAGNQIVSSKFFNSADSPFQTWQLEQKLAEWQVLSNDIEYSKYSLEVDESMSVSIKVRNIGTADGEAFVLVEAVDLAGTRTLLQSASITVPTGSIEPLVVDWRPTVMGIQWVEVSISGDHLANGEEIDVKKPTEEGILGGVMGDVDPIVLAAFALIVFALLVVVLMWLKDVGSRRDSDWGDEYWDDADDGYDTEDESDSSSETHTSSGKAPPSNSVKDYSQIYADELPITNSSSEPPSLSPSLSPSPIPNAEPSPSIPLTSISGSLDPYSEAASQSTIPAIVDPDDPNWMQDDTGHWWKKNEEGYWWRLGQDGNWYSPEENEYGWN